MVMMIHLNIYSMVLFPLLYYQIQWIELKAYYGETSPFGWQKQ